MQRVDRLLLKVQQARRCSAYKVSVAFVQPSGLAWEAVVNLWDGKPGGKLKRITMTYSTMEDAQAAVEKVNEEYGASEGTTIIADV